MNRQMLKRLAVKGTVAYVAVFSLVLMVAMPAIAVMAANSVDSAAIIDRAIRSRDIRNRAVIGKKIAKKTIRSKHVRFINDSKIRYSTKTRVLSISAQALDPTKDVYAFDKNSGSIGSVSGATFSAPVYLPNGAVVVGFKAELIDNSATKYTEALLRRWSTVAEDDLAEVTTSGASEDTTWRTFSDTNGISFATINNTSHTYYVTAYASGAGVAIGRIIITYKTARP